MIRGRLLSMAAVRESFGIRGMMRDRWLYAMTVPGIIYFLLFKYLPMWGVLIAFQDYSPFDGILHSQWVGMANFTQFFSDPEFWKLLRNTAVLAVYNLLFFFPLPIVVALMLNEVRREVYKRTVQSLIYLPHFMSWVIVASITHVMFTTEGGVVNEMLLALGMNKTNILQSGDHFRMLITSQVVWKETGWGTIIFLAAIAGVDPQQYEAARIDGAGRLRQMWHITLPAIRSTIVILFILRLGHFMDTGFEQIFLMLNALNRDVGEVFDTYVYTIGITQGQFSYSTAIGLFKSLVGMVLVVVANYAAKAWGEEGIY
jgi:putative aldouronate transport system permease protein